MGILLIYGVVDGASTALQPWKQCEAQWRQHVALIVVGGNGASTTSIAAAATCAAMAHRTTRQERRDASKT